MSVFVFSYQSRGSVSASFEEKFPSFTTPDRFDPRLIGHAWSVGCVNCRRPIKYYEWQFTDVRNNNLCMDCFVMLRVGTDAWRHRCTPTTHPQDFDRVCEMNHNLAHTDRDYVNVTVNGLHGHHDLLMVVPQVRRAANKWARLFYALRPEALERWPSVPLEPLAKRKKVAEAAIAAYRFGQ